MNIHDGKTDIDPFIVDWWLALEEASKHNGKIRIECCCANNDCVKLLEKGWKIYYQFEGAYQYFLKIYPCAESRPWFVEGFKKALIKQTEMGRILYGN